MKLILGLHITLKIFPGLMISRVPSFALIFTSFSPNCWWLMQCAGHSFFILVVKIIGFASGLPHDFWWLSAVTFSWLWNTRHKFQVRLLFKSLCAQFWGLWKPQLFKCCLKVETHSLRPVSFRQPCIPKKVITNISPIWIRHLSPGVAEAGGQGGRTPSHILAE